jgi:hypothetical protein
MNSLDQQRLAFDLLLALARFDPPLESGEVLRLQDCAQRLGLGWAKDDGRTLPPVADMGRALTSEALRRLVLDEASWLALADFYCSPEERQQIRSLAEEWGLPVPGRISAALDDDLQGVLLDGAQLDLDPSARETEHEPARRGKQVKTRGTLEVRVQSQQLCVFCRERLGSNAKRLLTCAGCRVVYHRACILEFSSCASTGCRNNRRTAR